jgi:hypothetical protein
MYPPQMIGVISREYQRAAVEEFFELFKTPWEHCRECEAYDVVITTDPAVPVPPAKLVIAFGSEGTPLDGRNGVRIRSLEEHGEIEWKGSVIPIYGQLATFENQPAPFLFTGGDSASHYAGLPGCGFMRVGYDLFDEIRFLLRKGQPVDRAQVPTLDIHIDMLRNWILERGIPLVEIPPSPYGYDFITCLTHDIDFMGIRDHKFDHTMLGFLYRSLVPKYTRGLDKKTTREKFFKNLRAVLSLPLVQAGLLPDIWYPLDKYAEVEKELKSTFFFIPFKDRHGTTDGRKPAHYRSARYDVVRFREQIRSLQDGGREVGLHGIDLWRDSRKGREELAVIRGISGKDRIGVRIHWLYFSEETPKCLEEAGVYYDSTLGYNETVGFRSGTTQVFRLPGTSNVFELPLHVQDTTMLYPGRMGVSEPQAIALCGELLGEFRRYGGAFTINWHDRSLAPERNWDSAYLAILGTLREGKTWFAAAGEAVSWFEKRRACRFDRVASYGCFPRVRMRKEDEEKGPALTIRVHRPMKSSGGIQGFRNSFVDYPVKIDEEIPVGYWA